MYKCVIQYCYSAHTDLLWVITKFPTIICSKEKKHKQKKILRLLGKHLNSYASRHKTVCGLKFFPCGQAVSVTTYCRVSGMLI